MEKRRDIDMANVSENLSDLGDKTTATQGGNIQGGSGGVQGRSDQGDAQQTQSDPGEESKPGGRSNNDQK